ncbi:MAG TPA: hypothetical protein VGG08_03735 [Solirubrobacteraceae bacterium]|jgi:hypothetical protein
MKSIRRHLNYANVVATFALLFAMSGGALAAKHFLINSTNQINPSVVKKLKGKTGKTGAQGQQGPQGLPGARGEAGERGEKGETGASPLSTLPPNQTESGSFAVRKDSAVVGDFLVDAITFPIPLGQRIPVKNVIYTTVETPVEHCPGVRHADPGYLCFYGVVHGGVKVPPFFFNSESEAEEEGEGASRVGVVVEFDATAADAFDWGSWAVTAL